MGAETVEDTSSPSEIASSKPFATTSEDPRCDDTPPNLSSHASSVTLAVNDKERGPKCKGGDQKKTASETVLIDVDKVKKTIGWPHLAPFRSPLLIGQSGMRIKENEDVIYWADMTWKQKMAWRKAFLSEYLSETKMCLPFVWKLYVLIYRLSPWKAVVLLVVSIFRGFLPALTLQTRGHFIMMVNQFTALTNCSCKKVLRKRPSTSEDCCDCWFNRSWARR